MRFRRHPFRVVCALSIAACAASPAAPRTSASAPSVAAPPAPAPAPTSDVASPRPQPDAAARELYALRDAAQSSARAFDTLRSLTDEVGARPAGSASDKAAVQWALRTLKAAALANVHAEPTTVPHWERGTESGAIVSPYAHRLSLTALGGSVGTSGVEAEVVEFPSVAELEKADKSQVARKIVFLDPVMEASRSGAGYGHAVPSRGLGPSVAAKLGAVGFVVRSVGTDHNRLPHTGAFRPADIPAAALSVPDAELLHRLIATRAPVRLQMSLGAHVLPDEPSANVMGELIGRDKPEEIVILGAHLDSWDLGTGALDDGAGCAIMIEAARLIRALPPARRTIRVVLFANEERGSSGAKDYVKAHEAEIARHIVGIEADFGAGRAYGVRVLGGPSSRAALLVIAARAQPLGVEPSFDDAFGGADLAPLRALGMPVIDVRQDGTTYFDHHHSANDTLDKVDPDALEQAASAYASIAYAAAEHGEDLGRIPEDKRKSPF